jgi:hypothetical protein
MLKIICLEKSEYLYWIKYLNNNNNYSIINYNFIDFGIIEFEKLEIDF